MKVEESKLGMFALGYKKHHLVGCALPWVTPFYTTAFAPFREKVLMHHDSLWFVQANDYNPYSTNHGTDQQLA